MTVDLQRRLRRVHTLRMSGVTIALGWLFVAAGPKLW